MEKEFVPYELALRMKRLGFDERTLRAYYKESEQLLDIGSGNMYDTKAPLYQQAFRWFREKYGLWFRPDYYDELKEYDFQGSIHKLGKYNAIADIGNHETPEEAELACLKKLIEIVEEKQKEL